MIHPKTAGATVVAAIAYLIIVILRQSGITVDADLGGAITVLAAAIGGWFPSSPTVAVVSAERVMATPIAPPTP